MSPDHLLTIGVVLAGTGSAMVWASAAPRRRRRGLSTTPPRTGRSGALMCTAVLGGVIAGLQWVLLSSTTPTSAVGPVWTAVLGLPAFLAGATLVRLARAMCAALGAYRRRREILRAHGRGGHR
jgi:hypothetical protein